MAIGLQNLYQDLKRIEIKRCAWQKTPPSRVGVFRAYEVDSHLERMGIPSSLHPQQHQKRAQLTMMVVAAIEDAKSQVEMLTDQEQQKVVLSQILADKELKLEAEERRIQQEAEVLQEHKMKPEEAAKKEEQLELKDIFEPTLKPTPIVQPTNRSNAIVIRKPQPQPNPQTSNEPDYYKILGVSRDATDKEIRSVYLKMARKYHPDKNKDPDASETFKKVQNAYETLGDNNKRAQYNQRNPNVGRTAQPRLTPKPTKDLYKVLGVTRDALPAQVKKAYFQLAQRYHPDARTNINKTPEEKTEMAEQFKEVSTAYEVLYDKDKRAEYDKDPSVGTVAQSNGPVLQITDTPHTAPTLGGS